MAAHRHVVLALLLTAGVAVFADEAPKFDPKDSILVNCGADKEGLDVDGRKWVSDKDSKWLVDGGKTSAMATAESGQDPSLPSPVPYMSARVFTKETVYNFPVAETDRHWVRLHFYPSAYHGVPADNFYFTMSTSTGLTLLRNFSVYITAKALSQAYIVREFSLPPVDTGTLSLTFTPVAMNNGSYAFINGIEIISIPPIFDKPAKGAELGNEEDMTTSNLQTMYRLNVGGSFIAPAKDSGLSREWYDDTPYIFGSGIGVTFQANDTVNITYPDEAAEFVAPANVYRTSRTMGPDPKVNINYMLTWAFEVDANFTYLVRLHFCEMLDNKTNERVFDILINNQTAESAADVFQWASSTNTPVYKDYTVIIKPNAANDSSLLILQLKPNAKSQPTFIDAILNGLEIFKKSDAKNNLAGPNPDLSKMMVEAELGVSEFKPKTSNLTATLIGGAAGGAAAFGIVAAVCLVAYQNKKRKELGNSVSHSSGWLPVYGGNSHTNASKSSGGKSAAVLNPAITAMCRHFSFYEIKSATKNFDESLVIGVGGFGKVYRGVVDGDTKVAIKRSNPSSEQGVLEFQTEIEMLSKLRHKHLVSLIGCCEDNGEMILVYDYMAHGTFREHLYKSNKPPLSWKQRLELTIGAARGLHYLHTGAKYTIIHRDVKTTNILVDDKWVAKVSDFGLSKTGPTAVNQAHVSTMVKGSFGYLDPEYFRRQQLTEKSDVYSFGVVLFEVLCARPVLNPSLPREQVSLADHAMSCQRKGTLQDIIDPVVKGKIAPDCLKKFSETAEKCLADHGVDRPSMGDVLWNLEFALQMQETFENGGKLEGENSVGRSNSTSQSHAESTAANLAALSLICEDMDEEDIANSVVFSQLVHPTGR